MLKGMARLTMLNINNCVFGSVEANSLQETHIFGTLYCRVVGISHSFENLESTVLILNVLIKTIQSEI